MKGDGERTANSLPNLRRDPRALVCARALLTTESGAATEHLTYDLSAGGARLCGVPRAEVGERVGLLLDLPGACVSAVARLLRVATGAAPEFALRFEEMDANDEDAIQDAVVEALARPVQRSVLLVQGGTDRCWQGWDWLAPLSSICTAAATPLEAVRCLEQHDFCVALLGMESASHIAEWRGAAPELTWRSIDQDGRLWAVRPRSSD